MTATHGRPKPGDPLYRVTHRRWIFVQPRSVIVGDTWYRFKRSGGLVVNSADLAKAKGYRVEFVRAATAEDIEYLEGNIGSEWSWLHNCVTVMARPLDERWAIAIRWGVVVLGLLLILMARDYHLERKHEQTRALIRDLCQAPHKPGG
jgi:hypothetical protein